MTQESTGLGTVEQLLRMRQKETAAANSCLRALRLTKQSQSGQADSGAVVSGAPVGQRRRAGKPWEVDGA